MQAQVTDLLGIVAESGRDMSRSPQRADRLLSKYIPKPRISV
jgi:hypothetical protein